MGKPQILNTRVRVAVTPDTPSYYANYIEVSNSQYDFSLSVARISSPLSEGQIESVQKGEPLQADAILQIILPPEVAEGLIAALTQQLKTFKDLKGGEQSVQN